MTRGDTWRGFALKDLVLVRGEVRVDETQRHAAHVHRESNRALVTTYTQRPRIMMRYVTIYNAGSWAPIRSGHAS